MEYKSEVRDDNDVIPTGYGKCWQLWPEKSYTPSVAVEALPRVDARQGAGTVSRYRYCTARSR